VSGRHGHDHEHEQDAGPRARARKRARWTGASLTGYRSPAANAMLARESRGVSPVSLSDFVHVDVGRVRYW
jgi:Uncharacterized protein conserved in bacteria